MAEILENFEFPSQRRERLKREREAKRQREEAYDKQMDELHAQQERQEEVSKPKTPSKDYDIPDWTD